MRDPLDHLAEALVGGNQSGGDWLARHGRPRGWRKHLRLARRKNDA